MPWSPKKKKKKRPGCNFKQDNMEHMVRFQ